MAQPKTTPPPSSADYEKALKDLKEAITVQRRVVADRDNAVRKAQEKHQPEIDRLTKDADTARDVIQRYAVANRQNGLLPEGAKSVCVNGVTLGWKLSSPTLAFKTGFDEEKALALVRKKLPDCIRKTEELNKPMLKVYATGEKTAKLVAACGLELKKGEETFFAKPETA